MIGTIPVGGLSMTGNSTAQAITTSAAQLTWTGGINTPTTKDRVGDPAVKPDVANNRVVVNSPGIYEVEFDGTGTISSAGAVTFQVRKGGASGSAISGTKQIVGFLTTASQFGYKALVEITAADIPTTGGVSAFDDPSASAGAGKPQGGFAGAGAAPKTGVALDVLVTGAGSVNLTLTDARMTVKRLG